MNNVYKGFDCCNCTDGEFIIEETLTKLHTEVCDCGCHDE